MKHSMALSYLLLICVPKFPIQVPMTDRPVLGLLCLCSLLLVRVPHRVRRKRQILSLTLLMELELILHVHLLLQHLVPLSDQHQVPAIPQGIAYICFYQESFHTENLNLYTV